MSINALLAAHWNQNDRLLRLTTPLGADTLLAEHLQGTEDLHHGYRLQLDALSEDAHLVLKSLIGQPVLLELQTSHSRTELRPFHGHITQVQQLGANGGLARYRMLIEPWTAFLGYNRDSTLYQDMTVFDILDSVFQDYSSQGQLNPQWRFDIADRSLYPKRSLTTQYQESDLAFVRRLLSEVGLFGWFDHSGDAQIRILGRHSFVIADHNEAFKANTQSEIEFAQAGTTIKDDKIDRWRMETRWVPAGVALQSWDYRQINTRPVSAQSQGSEQRADNASPGLFQDAPGAYTYETREQGERHAEHRLQALAAHHTRYSGESTVRTLAPATTFTLNGHASLQDKGEDESTFLVWRIEHTAHNNLSADLHALIAQNLGLAQPPGLAQDTATNAEQEKANARSTATAFTLFRAARLTAIHALMPTVSCFTPNPPCTANKLPLWLALKARSSTLTVTTVYRCSFTGNAENAATAA